MNKKYIESNHSLKKEKGKDKGKPAYMRIREGLAQAQADRMAKYSK
ncbi:hypothetical protein [Peribacillus frigoritolerans]|nr:hypothetical protein [Peribacillus frigoritolerans]MDM5313376.1 hypothetical protein [Peribacillus frigoritolerans]